jgi:hypothetical protein
MSEISGVEISFNDGIDRRSTLSLWSAILVAIEQSASITKSGRTDQSISCSSPAFYREEDRHRLMVISGSGIFGCGKECGHLEDTCLEIGCWQKHARD